MLFVCFGAAVQVSHNRQTCNSHSERPRVIYCKKPNVEPGKMPGSMARAKFSIQSWWTGEDSNLRSSQGAADLQSAAINHSATCPLSLQSAAQSEATATPGSTHSGANPKRFYSKEAETLERISPAGNPTLAEPIWSGRRESNPRPTAWKAVTLPLSYSRWYVTSGADDRN
jgi:hypothetical protein